jgi:hypothetical protein
MCVFCAAVPATLAVGTSLEGQQRAERREAAAKGQPIPEPRWPARKLTGVAVTCLVAAAVAYHTHLLA